MSTGVMLIIDVVVFMVVGDISTVRKRSRQTEIERTTTERITSALNGDSVSRDFWSVQQGADSVAVVILNV